MLAQNPFLSASITYPVVYWDDFLTEQELVCIEKYMLSQPIVDGLIGSTAGGINMPKLRNSKISFIKMNQENQWIFDKMVSIADFINNKFFQYELYGFDSMQYTEYAGNGTSYDYHVDMGLTDNLPIEMFIPRKLSFSLILSDSSEYSGGEFQYKTTNDAGDIVSQKRGRILAFPSFILHRIKPIISGTRRSLVFWAVGPKFK